MNETLTIRLKEGDRRLPLNSISADGVMLRNETDATPRSLYFEFDGDDLGTRARMERVRALHGWNPGVFKFHADLSDGNLVFAGVDLRAFPAGRYWFRLRIADLNLPTEKIKVEIPEDGGGEADLAVSRDKRDVRLTSAITAFDGDVRRVIEATASRVDGAAAADWLTSRPPRPARKACLLNLLAKLRTTPTEPDHLLRNVQHFFFADVDRIYARVDREFSTRVETLSNGPSKVFIEDDSPKSPVHRRLLDRIARFEEDVTTYHLHSYRQTGKNGMQAVIAIPDDPTRNHYADLDIDLGNPLQDLQGFVIHMGELINPGKTDHFALHDKLAANQTLARFLFYEVVNNA
jgi:hypothetical protein